MEKETEVQKVSGTSPWELAKEQGAEMADSRSQALNTYVFFLNLNAEIYQKEIYQIKSALEIFLPFRKVVVTIKITCWGGFGPHPQKFRFSKAGTVPRNLHVS